MSKCGTYSRSVKPLQSCESCQTSLTRALNQITGKLTSGACCSSGNGSKSNAETVSKGTFVDRSLPDCASDTVRSSNGGIDGLDITIS